MREPDLEIGQHALLGLVSLVAEPAGHLLVGEAGVLGDHAHVHLGGLGVHAEELPEQIHLLGCLLAAPALRWVSCMRVDVCVILNE